MRKRLYWLSGLGCGVAALVIGLGVAMKASADDKKPQPSELPKVLDDLDDILKNLPDGVDKDQLKKLLEMKKQLLQNRPNFGGGFGQLGQFGVRQPEEGRLGVHTTKPSDTLADQLDLPKGQGLVIEEVLKDSAAAKAGMKAHDILLELDGKPVANELREFKKALENVKADAAVDVVVLRKGKKETIKGVKLPEAKVEKPAFGGFGPNFPNFPNVPNVPAAPGFQFQFQFPGGQGFGGAGNVTMVQRNGDNFTVRQTEGGNGLNVSGVVEQGKAKVNEVQIIEAGKVAQTYDSVEKVPDTHKAKVKSLLQMIEK